MRKFILSKPICQLFLVAGLTTAVIACETKPNAGSTESDNQNLQDTSDMSDIGAGAGNSTDTFGTVPYDTAQTDTQSPMDSL